MAKLQIEKGSTNVTVNIFVQDSSSSVGAGLTGLTYNSAGLTCYYVRPLAAAAALSLATQTVTGIHSDGGFVEISSTNTPGLYRLDLSDAICASGVNFVTVELKGATNMVPVLLEIQLTTFDLNDASPEVTLASETHTGAVIPTVTTLTGHTGQTGDSYARLGAPAAASIAADLLAIDNFVDDLETRLSAARAGYLDNLNGHTPQSGDSYARLGAPAGASVSVDIADIPTGTELDARTLPSANYFDPAADTVATVTSVTNGVTVTTNNDKTGYSLSAAAIQSIWDALTSALVTVGSIGKLIVDNLDALISSRASSAEVGALNDISTAQVGAEVDSSLASYDGPTDTEMIARTLPTASYFDAANDEVDLGSIKGTALTETNAGDVAESFSFFYDVDPVTTKTVDDVGVAGSGITQQEVRDAMKLTPTGGAPSAGSVDKHLDDIEDDTNELQTDWADAGRLDNILDGRSSHSAADVTGGTTVAAAETNIRGGTDTLDVLSGQLDTAQTDLDNPNQYKADVSALALEANVQTHADAALTAYDAPTKAEMDARTLLAASYATAAGQAAMQADLDNPSQYKADVSSLALEATLLALLTTPMAESYAANGVAPTPAQALFIIQQSIGDFSIAGTTLTAKKIDGSTTAATYTLDDAVDPTSRTRAT